MDGIPGPACFWGKLQRQTPADRSSPVVAWHPLIAHCADVAACLAALLGWTAHGSLRISLFRRRLAALGGLSELDRSQVARLLVFAVLHDFGKANHGFQAKQAGAHALFTAGHVDEALLALKIAVNPTGPTRAFAERFSAALDDATWSGWSPGDGAYGLLVAAISHHGRPAQSGGSTTGGRIAQLWDPAHGRDPVACLESIVAATRIWLPEAWAVGGAALPDIASFQHGYCGLVQLADWLGSDTEVFPYSQADDDISRWTWALAAATQAVQVRSLDGEHVRAGLPASPAFQHILAGEVRPMQHAVGSLPLPPSASLTLIEEETGGGKTEAALWHYARLHAAGAIDGLYFALPTRTAATQLHARIVSARDRLFSAVPPDQRPPVILAVPGYVRVDDRTGQRGGEDQGRPLPRFEVLWNDRPERAERHRRWAAEHPKRFLAGCLVVGTIDQALLAALAVDHAHLRSACLLRHLLVVDEVHASDAYMTRILRDLLVRHRAAGGHALLMSATLGSQARQELFHAWGDTASATNLVQAQTMAYPALSIAGCAMQPVSSRGHQRHVNMQTQPAGDPAFVAATAIAAAAGGARVLIIRNTVTDCRATQLALEAAAPPQALWRPGGIPAPHHARYAREDRTLLDQAIEAALGKNALRQAGLIACATQTVQQALDLDADLLLTDLCPVDVLLQRIGRLHRHQGRPRPEVAREPRTVVLVPDGELTEFLASPRRGPHGWGTVYPDLRILELTRRSLAAGIWNIPADNRRLVEQATHPEALQQLEHEHIGWPPHGYQVQGAFYAQKDVARLSLLPSTISFASGALAFGGDLSAEIRTRLGEDDRLIELPPGVISPFGQAIHHLTMPGRWAHGLPEDAPDITPIPGGLRIAWQTRAFVYDRLGLRAE